jgi:anthranilate 1,2-dioxygenase small subunit
MIPADLILRLEMQELQDRYIATIDDDRLEDWPKLFVETCLYEIMPRENEALGLPAPLMRCEGAAMMRDRVLSLRQANIFEQPVYRHMVSGFVVTRQDDGTVAMSCNYLVVNTSQEGSSSIYQAGRYLDRVVQTPEGWRFASKRAIYDTLRVQTLLAYPI